MHRFYLNAKSTILYALPICFFMLLSLGGSFNSAEASELPSNEVFLAVSVDSIDEYEEEPFRPNGFAWSG